MKLAELIPGLLLSGLVLSACQSTPVEQTTISTPTEIEKTQPATSIVPTQSFDGDEPPAGAVQEFSTDFDIHSIPYDDILSGGPPKDGIPSIDNPTFVSVDEADTWLKPVEPVIQVIVNNEAKAYPLQILIWHELVNDKIADIPIVVSFCPLCNTAIVFERTVDGRVLDFGTTGRLRYSNLIMYDRQTETWWQQAEGKGIVGTLTDTQLEFVPAAIISWADFKNANPKGIVLSRDTGVSRAYGQNPYIGYDDVNNPPFLFRGPQTPGLLPPIARVLTVDRDNDVVAYPYETLEEVKVVNDRVGDEDIAVFWASGTSSALDTSTISEGKDVGTAATYSRVLDGTTLSFVFDGQKILDEQTGSTWDVLGHAVDGELTGKQLTPTVSVNHFWFSWAAFKPETRVYQP